MLARYAKTPPETNPAAPEMTYPARGRPVVRAMINIATTARADTATAQSSMPNRPRRLTLRLLVAGTQKDAPVPEAVASDTSVGGVFVYRGA
jgi:hypothetical protein